MLLANAGSCGGGDTCWYPEPGYDCSGGQFGCTDPSACNFTPGAVNDDGTCEYITCKGCTDATACNYDPTATIEDGSCSFADPDYDCDGEALGGGGTGCTDQTACNYDSFATINDGSCTYPAADYDCDGNYLGNLADVIGIDNDETNTAGAGDCVATVPHGVYFFYNDRIVRGVSDNEVNKQYDNLPRKAEAQAVVDNRLMYGNYLEGFNKVKTSCNATVRYQKRPPEGFDFKLRLVPAISQVRDLEAQTTPGDANSGDADVHGVNKCAGYIIDSEDIPSTIPPYTKVSVSLSVSPKKNFHVYNAKNSYHQSRHRGAFSPYSEKRNRL